MTDIAKCTGKDCPMREKCWRYTAPADERGQAWLATVPWSKRDLNCELFEPEKRSAACLWHVEQNGWTFPPCLPAEDTRMALYKYQTKCPFCGRKLEVK